MISIEKGINMENSMQFEAAESQVTIELKGISKFFKTDDEMISALQNITLTIPQGDCLAVHGPRKSGKTTLLKTLAGFSVPDKGSCFFNKKNFYSLLSEEQIKYRSQNIGYLPKSTPLIPTLTLEENIQLPLFYQGIAKKDFSKYLRPMLEEHQLYGKRHAYPHQVAASTCRLTAYLQAVVCCPAILIADDVQNDDLFSLLMQYQQQGNTLIITTKQDHFLRQCKHTIFIEEGMLFNTEEKK